MKSRNVGGSILTPSGRVNLFEVFFDVFKIVVKKDSDRLFERSVCRRENPFSDGDFSFSKDIINPFELLTCTGYFGKQNPEMLIALQRQWIVFGVHITCCFIERRNAFTDGRGALYSFCVLEYSVGFCTDAA